MLEWAAERAGLYRFLALIYIDGKNSLRRRAIGALGSQILHVVGFRCEHSWRVVGGEFAGFEGFSSDSEALTSQVFGV